MKIAIVKTGGKQYVVAEKNKLKIEKISGETGATVDFDQVLLVSDGGAAQVGKPFLAGVKVTAKILKQARTPKVEVVKYKNKIRYKRNKSHRQRFTEVEIEKIS